MKSRWGRKMISGAIVLAMMLPLFPSGANAEVPLSQAQITSWGKTRYYNTNGQEVTSGSPMLGRDNVVVSVEKSIEGTEIENEFVINLEVQTSLDISNIKMSADAAVVLVLDVSGSMGLTTPTYLSQLIAAANDFLDSFADVEGGAVRYVSLVTYSTDAKIESAWIDVTNPLNKELLQNAINHLKPSGATFMQGGLILARNLLRTDALPAGRDGDPIENRNVILFTDGVANVYIQPNSMNAVYRMYGASCTAGSWSIPSENGDGTRTSSDPATRKATEDMAASVKDDTGFTHNNSYYTKYNAKLFTIAFGGATETSWLANNIATNSSYAYTAGNSGQLNSVFAAINQRIESWAQAWIVRDPMGQNIEFIQAISQNDSDDGLLTFSGDMLEWDLKRANPLSFIDNIYTYQYSYRIKLDTTASTFVPNKPYSTNGPTDLSYFMVNENEILGDILTAHFAVPSVEGYHGSFDFNKIGESARQLPGCQFQLSHTTAGKPNFTSVSGPDGKVAFANIPSGFSYRLKETALTGALADLYNLSQDEMKVTVSMGQVLIQNSKGETLDSGFNFVNQKKSVDFSFTKIDGNLYSKNKQIQVLPEAEFAIYKSTQSGKEQELVPANVINGTQTSPYWTLFDKAISDSFGVVTLSLPHGHYMLVETQAPYLGGEQFVLPTGQWAIEIDSAASSPIKIVAVADANGQQPPAFTAENYLPNMRQHDLPFTGATGIVAFMFTGSIIVILGLVLFLLRKVFLRRATRFEQWKYESFDPKPMVDR